MATRKKVKRKSRAKTIGTGVAKSRAKQRVPKKKKSKALLSDGLPTYTWLAQSTAWGGYNQYPDWNIKQGATGTLCKLSVDSDQAKATYGGFKVAWAGLTL